MFSAARKPHAGTALGVFFVALATLVLEISLTRIFSVTLWYHFGAMAISLAMLGLGASAVLVYLNPSFFSRERVHRQLSTLCALFAATIAISFYLLLKIEFVPTFSPSSIANLALLYAVTALPFFFSGLCIALIFAHFADQIGRLYFVDLVGAGLGCLVAVVSMSRFPAPTVVLFASTCAGVGSICFSLVEDRRRSFLPAALTLGLLALVGINQRVGLYEISFVKGEDYARPEYEAWNSYAYVSVSEVRRGARPFGWGLSNAWHGPTPSQRMLKIDADAATPITEFTGDLSVADHILHDVSSIAHTILSDHKVLILGAGGGRDILAALAAGAVAVDALEYNRSVVEAVNERFADFSGGIYEQPGVRKIVAEGRSYVQRTDEHYDLIQASLVDSWAANASGAYVMAENFLYTREAFESYLEHLTDDGILSMTRFNFEKTPQGLRVLAIAREVLSDAGVQNPSDHLIVVRAGVIVTTLISKSPFRPDQIQMMRDWVDRLDFTLEWAPGESIKSVLGTLASTGDPENLIENFPLDISVTTDDRPFFFHMANSPSSFQYMREHAIDSDDTKWYGTFVLLAVLVIATLFAILCIVVPLYTFRREDLQGVSERWPMLLYFSCLGIGFMLVEIPLMQRFTLFLGHPVYALSVVLFSLLLFAGCGSYLSTRWPSLDADRLARRSLALLLVLLLLYNFLLPTFMGFFLTAPISARIMLAALALLPLGILLGIPLPAGVAVLERRAVRMVPWAWGINGAWSVFASLFALAMAMTVGFRWTMLIGTASYAVAFALMWRLRSRTTAAAE